MLFHKKTDTNWPMIIFGLIVIVAIILAIGVLVMLASKVKNRDTREIQKETKEADVTLEISTPESVNKNYISEVKTLIEKVENTNSFSEIWKEIEPTFFNLRVPEEKIDLHLDVFLKLQKMDKNGKDAKEGAVELLKKLAN